MSCTPDSALLFQDQTRRNPTLPAGFGTYSQDEEHRPHKGPDDVGLHVQPATVGCHILVKGSRKGHPHDKDWKPCRKTHRLNPRKSRDAPCRALCTTRFLQNPPDQAHSSTSLQNPTSNINSLQLKSVLAQHSQIYKLPASFSEV